MAKRIGSYCITAMQNDEFSMGVGRDVVEIIGETSVLKKFDGSKLNDVAFNL